MVEKIKIEKLEDVDRELNRTTRRMITLFVMHNIFGVTQMVFGWFIYDYYDSYAVFYEGDKFGRDITVSVLCSFIGLSFLINAFCGYTGSIKRSLVPLGTCLFILLFLCIVSVVYICMAFKVNLEILLLFKNRQIPIWDIKDHEIRAAVDFVQTKLGCCGSSNYTDYVHLDLPNNTMVEVATPIDDNSSMFVPLSCCVSGMPKDLMPISGCWHLGCRDEFVNTIVHFSFVNSVAGLFALLLAFSSVLYIRLLGRFMANMKVKKARIIAKITKQKMTKTLKTKALKAGNTHGKNTTDHVSIDLKIPTVA